jgi:hypothetical protein
MATLWLPTPISAAETCIACRYFESMEIDGGSRIFADVMARLKALPTASVSLRDGAFCESGPGASVSADLISAADRQFERAEEIAKKTNECPQACAPKLNEAEYCAYSDRLVADRYRLGAVALRLSDLGEIYERAGREAKLPIEVLSSDMTLYGGEALNVLKDASKALAKGASGDVPDVRWQASSTEVAGLFGAVALLADFSLIEGDYAQIETALEKAAAELNTVRDDLMLALTRAKVMEPSEQLALEERLLTGASNLSWVIASLQTSAEAAVAKADASLSTDANAVPPGRNAAAIQETVGCLTKLSLSAITGSEAPSMTDEMLNDCRSFEPCRDKGPVPSLANVSPLRALLETQDEADKQTFALVKSMCTAN